MQVIGEGILKAFNKQINEEIACAYIYLSMAAWFTENGFEGMAQPVRRSGCCGFSLNAKRRRKWR